ncbi:phosphodiester glycosidase family protein [Dysgonomonadaceae bacterium zrk40]|nr:phosphodiester glycosidase family protein [Dysgonomonadaceae bacterium zrk40]
MITKKYLFMLIALISMTTTQGCSNNEYALEYSLQTQTTVGEKLVGNTNLFGHIISDSTYMVTSGVEATEVQYLSQKGLAMKIFIMQVDLSNPALSIGASMPNNKNSFAMQRMTLQASHADTEENKVWAGINGDFYNMTTGVPQGIVYRNGTAVKTTFQDAVCTYFAVTHDGKAIVAGQEQYPDLKDQIKEAVGGRVWLVQDGAVVKQTNNTVEPRTSIGVSEDGTQVYILAVDGRNFHYSNGMSYDELGQCLKALGAYNAINLDGGGSTTFFIRNTPDFTDDRFEIRNWPSDNGGDERSVANGLLIFSNE